MWRGGGHVATSSATIALVIQTPTDERQRAGVYYDLGQATMAMMLAAADLGIGSGHSAVGDQELARSVLALPPDRTCAYLIAFGYPADRRLRPIAKPSRRPFEEVVHYGRW